MRTIPKIKQATSTCRLDTPMMCRSCAYQTPSTPDEELMTKWYHAEHAMPHPCHERRNGWVCKGSLNQFKSMGLEIDLNLLAAR